MQTEPLILTLELKSQHQEFFNVQRKLYFPAERNFLGAHLTLFHQLPSEPDTISHLSGLRFSSFEMKVTGLMKLGGGVAYRIEGSEVQRLHQQLKLHFQHLLTPQDLQPFRPHITIQNKVAPQKASLLFEELSADFKPFTIVAIGLQLWTYLGGPWRPERAFRFNNRIA